MHYYLVLPAAIKGKPSLGETACDAGSQIRRIAGLALGKVCLVIAFRVYSCRISSDFEPLSIRTDVKKCQIGHIFEKPILTDKCH